MAASDASASGTEHDRRLSAHRLLRAMHYTSIDQVLEIVLKTGGEADHYLAKHVLARNGEPIVRVHMSGTKNSRRFIHVYLWWITLLGPNFPISDRLLRSDVWKNMRCLCGKGILDTRGHHNDKEICINPHHYLLESSADIESVFNEELLSLADDVQTSKSWRVHRQVTEFIAALRALLASGPQSLEVLAQFVRDRCPEFPDRSLGECDVTVRRMDQWRRVPPPQLGGLHTLTEPADGSPRSRRLGSEARPTAMAADPVAQTTSAMAGLQVPFAPMPMQHMSFQLQAGPMGMGMYPILLPQMPQQWGWPAVTMSAGSSMASAPVSFAPSMPMPRYPAQLGVPGLSYPHYPVAMAPYHPESMPAVAQPLFHRPIPTTVATATAMPVLNMPMVSAAPSAPSAPATLSSAASGPASKFDPHTQERITSEQAQRLRQYIRRTSDSAAAVAIPTMAATAPPTAAAAPKRLTDVADSINTPSQGSARVSPVPRRQAYEPAASPEAVAAGPASTQEEDVFTDSSASRSSSVGGSGAIGAASHRRQRRLSSCGAEEAAARAKRSNTTASPFVQPSA